MEFIAQRRYNMNRRSQMQGGKKRDFARKDTCKLVLLRFSLAGNLENPLMSLYGSEWRERGYGLRARIPRGVCTTDGSKPDFALDMVRPMSSSATSTCSQSVSCMGRWIPFKPV
jgi:hypothetical protein